MEMFMKRSGNRDSYSDFGQEIEATRVPRTFVWKMLNTITEQPATRHLTDRSDSVKQICWKNIAIIYHRGFRLFWGTQFPLNLLFYNPICSRSIPAAIRESSPVYNCVLRIGLAGFDVCLWKSDNFEARDWASLFPVNTRPQFSKS